MIDQNEVIEYFDRCAPAWDAEMIRSDEKIARILDNAHVGPGSRVLDVACGTGVLIPDYLSRGVAGVTGVDISPEMIRIAEGKFPQENVHFICGDVEQCEVGSGFDAIVVYNAFPHFPDAARLIRRLSSLLREGGILTVAHGMSREDIDGHHRGSASRVSNGLMPADELARLFARTLTVTVMISDEGMYQVAGRRCTQTHEHEHTHGHEHTHEHEHGAAHTHSGIPTEALLKHMTEHNISHLRELTELGEHMDGAARDTLEEAVDTLREGNDLLEKALLLLQSGL